MVLAGLGWLVCLCYLDDLVVHARTMREHLERLELVLERIHGAGLTIKLVKCHFAERKLRVLGHIVSDQGLSVDPEKVKAITEFKPPREDMKKAAKIKLVQSYVGMVNYYRAYVENFAILARPLTELTKKNATFCRGPAESQSFEDLRNAMLAATTDEACEQVGTEWLIQQSKELKAAGVPVIHYYTLGKPRVIKDVVSAIF